MEKTIKLEEQVICITGTANNKAWYKELADANIKTTKSIAKKTTLVIAQDTWGRLCTEAGLKGLTIINEKRARTLLADGELVIQVKDAPEGASTSTQIAEARSVLDGAPDNAMWVSLIKLIDGTSSTQLNELIDYLDPIVSRWEPGPGDSAQLDRELIGSNFIFWDRGVRSGELRVMPPSWVSESMEQEPGEKLRLVRNIIMTQIPFKLTGLKKMLDSSHLTHLRSLAFGGRSSPRLSASFYKSLPKMNGTKELETLILNSWNEKSLAALDAWANWTSVRTLGFTGHGDSALLQKRDEKHISTLYRSAFGQQITTLQVDTGHDVGYFDYGIADLTADALPNLERIEVYSYSNDYLHNSVKRAALVPRAIPTLALMGPVDTLQESAFESLASQDASMYTNLDLSTLNFIPKYGDSWLYMLPEEEQDKVKPEEARDRVMTLFRERFAMHFKGSTLAQSIDAIRLGSTLHDPAFAKALEAAGVEVLDD